MLSLLPVFTQLVFTSDTFAAAADATTTANACEVSDLNTVNKLLTTTDRCF